MLCVGRLLPVGLLIALMLLELVVVVWEVQKDRTCCRARINPLGMCAWAATWVARASPAAAAVAACAAARASGSLAPSRLLWALPLALPTGERKMEDRLPPAAAVGLLR
jgi:hypothetical protein